MLKSVKVFNYPYQAFEEAVVNALYHRDYMEREPVEITIEPTHIDILSYAGPDRSISAEAIKEAKKLKARRYRNRRLGDFLKELGLTEGRATGIPTIQKHLKLNGNNPAVIETDDERSYFLLTIPCREGFEEDVDTSTQEEWNMPAPLLQVLVQVKPNSKYSNRILELISSILDTLILLQSGAHSANDIKNVLEFGEIKNLKRYILTPLVDLGYITMTIPDKPNSRNQAYKLTDKGIAML